MKIFKIYFALLLCGATHLDAVEDMYHQNIRSQLEQQYGISGGTWALADNETQAIDKNEYLNCTGIITSWRGLEPFSRIAELCVEDIRINPWDQAVRLNSSIPVQKGDALLLIMWMNNVDSTAKTHAITHVFETTESPFEKSLYLDSVIKPGWRQWLIPFEAETNYAAGHSRYQLNLGHMKGDLQIAGVAIINFGVRYQVKDLPLSTHHLEYDGREDSATWRTEALNRINRIRKGDLRVQVVNKFNEPVQGASVHASMQRHEFGFGSSVSSTAWFDESYDSRIYLQKLINLTGDGRSFNIVSIENALKWPAWEDAHLLGDKKDVAHVVGWLADRDIKIRGHNLLWPNWEYMPADMQTHQNDPAYLTERIQGHIYEQVRYNGLKGIIDEWDVVNEMGICHDLVNALGSNAIYADALTWAAQSDSKAKLYLNENNIIADGGLKKTSRDQYRALLDNLSLNNVPLHGIGFQGHMNSSLTSPETILNIFAEFESYDLDISITEYDAVDINEELAADYMRDILIAAFSHESVKSFIMWGFWDGSHWQGDSPIFRRDWSVKPSGEAFINWVFYKWWTDVEGTSGAAGDFSTRAFFGDYSIIVEFEGQKTEAIVEFSKSSKDIILHVDTEHTSVQPPLFYRLEQNYPNPFNGSTTIHYEMPFREHVTIDLFDLHGRHMDKLVNVQKPAGRHTLQINSEDLPSGLYYYRLQAGNFRQTKKMLLIK